MKAVEMFDGAWTLQGIARLVVIGRDLCGRSTWENHRKGITGVPIGRMRVSTSPILNASGAARCVVPNGRGG